MGKDRRSRNRGRRRSESSRSSSSVSSDRSSYTRERRRYQSKMNYGDGYYDPRMNGIHPQYQQHLSRYNGIPPMGMQQAGMMNCSMGMPGMMQPGMMQPMVPQTGLMPYGTAMPQMGMAQQTVPGMIPYQSMMMPTSYTCVPAYGQPGTMPGQMPPTPIFQFQFTPAKQQPQQQA
uniref:Uncharacterized protein n=1 Tax=Schistocephalus solidus TaxID=70667 RepID=A0A0X3P144_SCHSO